jgi:hypothetical protein
MSLQAPPMTTARPASHRSRSTPLGSLISRDGPTTAIDGFIVNVGVTAAER